MERKLISTELTEKMPLLLDLMNNEMDQAKEEFELQEVDNKLDWHGLMTCPGQSEGCRQSPAG